MKNNEDIIRDFYEHIVSDNLLGQLEGFVSEDCTVWADGQSEKVGVNGMKEHLEAIRHTYPDYRMRILRQFVSGDYVISEFRMEGTFQNEWIVTHLIPQMPIIKLQDMVSHESEFQLSQSCIISFDKKPSRTEKCNLRICSSSSIPLLF